MAERVEERGTAAARGVELARRATVPRWAITTLSVLLAIGAWEFFGRDINPVFGSYPSAIAVAFWELVQSGALQTALAQSLEPFAVGFGCAILVGVPLGLVIGGFRFAEAALGIYVTAGYALPLIALVPLLMLWLGLGFAVKAAVVGLMSIFPITINTWLGVKSVPKKSHRRRQILGGATAHDPAPHRAAGDAALYHGRHPPGRGPRRRRHDRRRILHGDLGPGRHHHQFRQ